MVWSAWRTDRSEAVLVVAVVAVVAPNDDWSQAVHVRQVTGCWGQVVVFARKKLTELQRRQVQRDPREDYQAIEALREWDTSLGYALQMHSS